MKMKPEHLKYLKAVMETKDTDFHRSRYKAAGLSDQRYQWDLLHYAGLTPYVCSTLYTYLNDEHISSAMRSFIKPL